MARVGWLALVGVCWRRAVLVGVMMAWACLYGLLVEYGVLHQKEAELRKQRCWKRWVAESFMQGARAAHNLAKGRSMQEVIEYSSQPQPWQLADAESAKRQKVWEVNKLAQLMVPAGYAGWWALRKLDGKDLRGAIRLFPWKTAMGAGGIHPRSLEVLSDQALDCLAALYERCETMGVWGKQLATVLVRLPKDGGISRFIGLIDTLVRAWGRARRPLSASWEVEHKCQEIWGTGQGMSSSDAACVHDLAAALGSFVCGGSRNI